MSTPPKKDGDMLPPPNRSTVVLLLMDIGSTTWRVFAPTILFTVVGIYIDKQLRIEPWLSIGGVLLGAGIGMLLVRKQLRSIRS